MSFFFFFLDARSIFRCDISTKQELLSRSSKSRFTCVKHDTYSRGANRETDGL